MELSEYGSEYSTNEGVEEDITLKEQEVHALLIFHFCSGIVTNLINRSENTYTLIDFLIQESEKCRKNENSALYNIKNLFAYFVK